jgi:hypothetical protein
VELTPTSTIYSPLLTDIEKFGTPGTRYSILTEAQSNIIWEASDIDDDDDNDDGGTSMATSVTTPISSSSSVLHQQSQSTTHLQTTAPISSSSSSHANKSSLLHQMNFNDIDTENIQPPDQNSPHRDQNSPQRNREPISPNKSSSMTIIVDTLCYQHHHDDHPTNTKVVSLDEALHSTQDDNDANNIHHHIHTDASSSSSSRFNQMITLCKSDNDQVDQKYVSNHLAQMNVMKRIQHFDALSAKRSTPLKLSLPASSLPSSSSMSSSSLPSSSYSSSSSSLISSSNNESPAFNRIRIIPAPQSINRGLPELRYHTRSISRDA